MEYNCHKLICNLIINLYTCISCTVYYVLVSGKELLYILN